VPVKYIWFFEAVNDLVLVINLEPVECDGWAGDIAAEFFEFLSLGASYGDAGCSIPRGNPAFRRRFKDFRSG
jgi:hypothetical protein